MTAPSTGPGEGKAFPAIASVLVVEDNMIIALDTEDVLRQIGISEVTAVANANAALAEMERRMPDFALLDFNLGHESSERVAEALAAAGVPFCYATGYGEALAGLTTEPPCGVIRKPYSQADLVAVLERATSG